ERAGFHSRIVGNDHARNAFDIADSCDNSRRGNFSPLLVHLVSGPKADLEKWRVLIEQKTKPLAHRQASHFALTLVPGLTAPFTKNCFLLRNGRAMRAKHFTRARSRHMPEPRLICEDG